MPTLLDLFAGAGGCTVGYQRAGYTVTAVDHDPDAITRNPAEHVEQGDVRAYLADLAYLRSFDAVHASPPCQAWTSLRTRHRGRAYPELIDPTRAALIAAGVPYVIENVVGAPLLDPLVLCGSMYGLGVGDAVLRRHRLFESNVPLTAPAEDTCAGRPTVGVYGTGGSWTRTAPGGGGVKVSGAEAAAALGVDWTVHQPVLAQMIPPAYTESIGRQLLAPGPAGAPCARATRGPGDRHDKPDPRHNPESLK